MTVNVQCPSCGKSYHVGDESIGARAKCQSCGATFTLSMSIDDTGKSKSDEALADADKAAHKPPDRSAHGRSSAGKARGHRVSSEAAAKADGEQVPKKLGHYVVQRKLGAGAMGVVYLARDPILDRLVAIKVLPAELSTDEERLKRFLREAKSAARLHHTNVAAVHQAGAEGWLTYIAMEYVEGMSLDKAVSENKPMAWREATRVFRDAAAGLGAAHAIGLVHRDIKPANLIRTKDGVTKVVDFGLARGQQTHTQLTQQGTLLGTPAYMAPEQWSGGEVDGRSDLYSLTCTYYFLLTGRLPFDAPSLPALGYQHRYEAFPDPRQHVPNLPDGICRILTRGSAKEPSERYQNAAELVAQLEVLLACPNESLTFGSSWAQVAASAGSGLVPREDAATDRPTHLDKPDSSEVTSRISVVVGKTVGRWAFFLLRAVWTHVRQVGMRCVHKLVAAVRSHVQLPRWLWITACGVAALLLLLAVMITFSTKYGIVRIALQGVAAKDVDITLDGEKIAIQGLDEPLEVKVGEHNLIARSANLETVTRSFRVKRNETTAVEVTFVPKVAAGPAAKPSSEQPKPAAAPPAMQLPATYQIQIEPPETTLAVSGPSASVSGEGAERTIKVLQPDEKTTITLVATLDGYRTLTRALQPVAGQSRDLSLRLERIPETPPRSKTIPPASSVTRDAALAAKEAADEAQRVARGNAEQVDEVKDAMEEADAGMSRAVEAFEAGDFAAAQSAWKSAETQYIDVKTGVMHLATAALADLNRELEQYDLKVLEAKAEAELTAFMGPFKEASIDIEVRDWGKAYVSLQEARKLLARAAAAAGVSLKPRSSTPADERKAEARYWGFVAGFIVLQDWMCVRILEGINTPSSGPPEDIARKVAATRKIWGDVLRSAAKELRLPDKTWDRLASITDDTDQHSRAQEAIGKIIEDACDSEATMGWVGGVLYGKMLVILEATVDRSENDKSKFAETKRAAERQMGNMVSYARFAGLPEDLARFVETTKSQVERIEDGNALQACVDRLQNKVLDGYVKDRKGLKLFVSASARGASD